jgi:hypothetical protein
MWWAPGPTQGREFSEEIGETWSGGRRAGRWGGMWRREGKPWLALEDPEESWTTVRLQKESRVKSVKYLQWVRPVQLQELLILIFCPPL